MNIRQLILDPIIYRADRSGGFGWEKARKEYITNHIRCEICGYESLSNDVHHIIPRHIDASLLTDQNNLITLCRKYDCHLRFGHFGNYTKYWNPKIRSIFLNTGEIMAKEEIEFKTIIDSLIGKS